MGLLKWFQKKKTSRGTEGKKTIQEYLDDMEPQKTELQVQEAYKAGSREECMAFIENACAQIREAGNRLKEDKEEYASTGSALNDVQIVDTITGQDRIDLNTAAEKIVEVNIERSRFQSTPSKISEHQYQRMEEYGEEIRDIMKKLDEDEKYSRILQNNMEKLEGEKATIRYDADVLEEKVQVMQKVIRWAVGLLGISITFYLVAIVLLKEQYDIFLYSMLGGLGIILAAAFVLFQRSVRALRYEERKLNKAIALLNSTKLRYVNISNSISYQYEKYGVNSAYELNHIWGLYLEEKRQRELYRHSSKELHEAEAELIGILSEYMLQVPRVWVNYAKAIIDPKEMVEVRHELNVRRQRLRSVMEYNQKVMERVEAEIQKFVRLNKEYAEEILQVMKHHT